MRILRWLPIVIVLGVTPVSARTVRSYAGTAIPQKLNTANSIFVDSDTLFLNGRQLVRDSEYNYIPSAHLFDLSRVPRGAADTLVVIYGELPPWAGGSYGREIPEAIAAIAPVAIPPEPTSLPPRPGAEQDLRLSGAKTFRFSARNGGSNDFGQSLDLKITGELSPGLTLTGALSDRGYDPAYGTATSRLNELDRLNLQLSSQQLLARIGDITLGDAFGGPAKNVSGVSAALSYPSWRANAAAARPKGRYNSITVTGENGYQGPYQVGAAGTAHPVVPGSETVYLDGRQLERGGDKDYTIDYPSGQVTFGVRNPIDRRSRIEIDFEPLATSYRQELLAGGGGIVVSDSTVRVHAEVLREGDDRQQMILGDLTDSDKFTLVQAGDADSYRSGIRQDTAGDYSLVTDSLPDSVFQYVGSHQGQYAVTFSFVGRGKGAYLFLGNNNFQFVGVGQGDYLPLVQIPRPERTDYYRSALDIRTVGGLVHADIRQSRYDKNLWSTRDDGDNEGLYYSLNYGKDWQWHSQANGFRFERRVKEVSYKERSRVNEADFAREYLVPTGYIPQATEALHTGSVTVSPAGWLAIAPSFGQLRYGSQFRSTAGGLGITFKPTERLVVGSMWRKIAAEVDSSEDRQDGRGTAVSATGKYRITERYALESSFERDTRQDSYGRQEQGTRYNRWGAGIGSQSEALRYERYDEDSLMAGWRRSAIRDRVMASSTRKFGGLSYTSAATWQHLEDLAGNQNSFLGQTSLNYIDTRRQWNISSSYLISDELRNARGIAYLEVEPGRGNYVLEDGRYIPDPDGNYIQVEELLSNRARVRRGEKTFALGKEWKVAEVRFSSSIQEELLESGKRELWWVLPFLTDERQPYLFFARRYDATVRLLPWGSFHAVNVLLSDDVERRSVAETEPERRDSKANVTLKQAAGVFYMDESVELFRSDRDSYYSGVGAVDGFRVATTVKRVLPVVEVRAGLSFRRASGDGGEKSSLYSLLVGSKVKTPGQGELRGDLEVYRQDLSGALADYSYQLTESKYGTRGAVWTVGANYAVHKGMKLNLSFTGHHSNERPGRVTGRGEVVASF